ncbi:MAG: Hsp20 family protein [Bacillus sp. (in: firmicutes)]
MHSGENNQSSRRKGQQVPFSDFIMNMDQLFGGKTNGGVLQSVDRFFQSSPRYRNTGFPLGLTENKDSYILQAKLPGVRKNQISLQVIQQDILITVNNMTITEERDNNHHVISSQSQTETVSRRVHLPNPINSALIHAEHIEGLLTITIPKAKGKKIRIDQ